MNLTKPQTKHLLNLISALINFEGKKNLSNLNRNLLNTTNPSNLNRFLTLSPWDEEKLNKRRLKIHMINYLKIQIKISHLYFLVLTIL